MWTQQDRDKAIWHAQYKSERCAGCGTHPDDWDPSKGGSRHAWVAVETRCPGCAATEQAQEAVDSRPKNERVRGLKVVLRRPEVPADGSGAGVQHGRTGAASTTVPVGS